MALELPEDQRPRFEVLRTDSASFAKWVDVRANRRDQFFVRPAGAADICNLMPPVREVTR
jgi:peptidylprolyl isomerase